MFSMITESIPKSSVTMDTAFRKDLTLQGCPNVLTRMFKSKSNGKKVEHHDSHSPSRKQCPGSHLTKLPDSKSGRISEMDLAV